MPWCKMSSAIRIEFTDVTYSQFLQVPSEMPISVGLEDRDEMAMCVRMEDLASLRQSGFPSYVKLKTWQSPEGLWVVAIAFCIQHEVDKQMTGRCFLNPRRPYSRTLLWRLCLQECIHFIFFSPDLHTAKGAALSWSPEQRQELTIIMNLVGRTPPQDLLPDDPDPDFEQAQEEFQRRYTIEDMLNA